MKHDGHNLGTPPSMDGQSSVIPKMKQSWKVPSFKIKPNMNVQTHFHMKWKYVKIKERHSHNSRLEFSLWKLAF